MDYKEEQCNEIEALDSIYCGELEIIETEPWHHFAIQIKSEEYEPGTDCGLSCRLEFTYTPKYPDEPPIFSIEDEDNFFEDDTKKLREHIEEEIKINLGTVMLFSVISSAQEWLNVQWDMTKLQRQENAAKKLLEYEEAERKRFEGTRVTVESFLKWKEKFCEDMGYNKKKMELEKESKKLTGRELFMNDKNLDKSDLQFLEDGDDVKVDESLFQCLDDLDLNDDDDDYDPDYAPGDSDSD